MKCECESEWESYARDSAANRYKILRGKYQDWGKSIRKTENHWYNYKCREAKGR